MIHRHFLGFFASSGLLVLLLPSIALAAVTNIYCELDTVESGSSALTQMDGSAQSSAFTNAFRLEGKAADFIYIASMSGIPEFDVTLADQATGLVVQNMIQQDSLSTSLGSDLIQIAVVPASGQWSIPSNEFVVLSCGLRAD